MSPRKRINGPSATRVASTPVPKITKGKRSTRRRRIYQNVRNDDLSAMHVLADIAGEILEEDALINENPKPDLIKPEPLDRDSCRRANSRVSKKVDSKKVSPGKSTYGENKRAFCDSKLVYTRQRTQFKKEAKKENVKLSIKSVKIPELVLEVSETSTIASLKKRVLEAMIVMLGKELDVGVTLQGTKFQDENLNLAQAEKLNDLVFSLEHKSKSSRDNSHVTVEKPISVPLPTPNPNPLRISNLNPLRQQSPICANLSKAIVVNQMQTEEPLAVIPSARKSMRVEPVVQRRIRRPFSVGEVEALVRAVEKLGTGRWRDVKIRAFDDAEHRTYVDLKDKWKTLVHTASIAPQQRRGEPVPQDLLDRVLAAQSYWNQQKGSETCPLAQN